MYYIGKRNTVEIGGRILHIILNHDGGIFVKDAESYEMLAQGHLSAYGSFIEENDAVSNFTIEDCIEIEACVWEMQNEVRKMSTDGPCVRPALLIAVQDLLCELRIDTPCLEVMARGYSPNYYGAMEMNESDAASYEDPHCKVQLSKVVAQKLIDCGVTAQVKRPNEPLKPPVAE